MASILRSSKFVRYIVGFTRNVVLNTPREFDGSLVNNTSQCFCGAIPRSLTTQVSFQPDQSLEKRLKTLDQDVRRSGRISRRDIEDVLEEIRNSRSATSSQSLLVIRCCGNLVPEELPEIRTKLVQEIWNTLNKLNIPMDISHYNALLRVYLENEHKFSPTDFLAELEAKGIEPNRVTYQRLIARYCQDGDIEGATRILEFMREKQMAVNENVFNALIVGHSKAGDMDSAEGILSVMSQAGLEPSADTYTTLLCGYAQKGDIENIKKTLDECEKKEIFLLDKDYFDVIYSLATAGHSEHIPFILSKVRKAIGYNQDAINLILRLINKGQEEAAFIVLKSMPRGTNEDGTPRPTGTFFLRQLVKANRPVEKILEYCELFEKEQFHPNPLLFVTQASLETGNENVAYALMKKLQENGVPIRQHFFWPLIVSKANQGSEDGIVDVLVKMQEFKQNPTAETIRDYVLPNMKGDTADVISKLTSANISAAAVACSLTHRLLLQGKIAEAANIMMRISAYYYPDLLRRPLTNAFYSTRDLESYITIIRKVHDNVGRKELVEADDKSVEAAEVVGYLVLDLASSPSKFAEVIEPVLAELVEEGLSITATTAEKIQDKLGDKMNENISNLLSKLSSGELTPVDQHKKLPSYVPANQMNIPQLERLIENLKAKGQDHPGLQRQLLTLYCRARDLPKVERLLQEMGDKLQYTNGVLAQLCEVYAANDKLEESLKYYERLKEQEGDGFALDASKIIRIVQAFVNNDRFDEGFEFLQKASLKVHRDQSFLFRTLVWRLLNTLAEQGKVEEVQKVFDYLLQKEIIEPANTILGPLVKVHLVRDDLDRALEVFADCCTRYRATPFKYELACKLIQNEDAENLQKVTDLSTTVHGEVNSLYDLVFAFIECGRIRQARKILEIPGMQGRPQKINFVCERYRQEGMVRQLEDLKEATKDLSHIDRSDIYYQLLMSYIKQEDIDKALGLWTQLQEEDLLPTDQFLTTLGNFLKERNIPVPFVIPQPKPSETQKIVSERKIVKRTTNVRERINSGDLDWAVKAHKDQPDIFTDAERSYLVEKLVQNGRLSDAKTITLQSLERNSRLSLKIMRFLFNKLALNGDVESLQKIGLKLNEQDKKLLSFDNRLCNAHIVAGRAGEYLSALEEEISNAKDEEVEVLYQKFPRGGAFGILEKHPELVDKFKTLAEKYAARGVAGPMNVLWSYYFIKGNDAEGEEIWNKYVKDSPRVMFQRILQHARETNDETLARKLIDHLKSSKVTEGALGNAYSCLLDVLSTKGAKEELIEEFEKAIKDVNINLINRTAVLRTKVAYEQLGRPFNYKVPTKADKQSTTSSSSSEEEKRRQN